MPTYERLDDAGVVVERSVTFTGTPHDLQLSHAAVQHDSPWHLVDELGEPAQAATVPTFVEPAAQPDSGGEHQADAEQQDEEPDDESGDDTEE